MKRYADITGDGGSDVLGQVRNLHGAIGNALAGVRHRVAVGSGKGGVGKSTVTHALAQALNRRGRSVTILDADFNGPCQARMGGLEGAPWVPGERGLTIPCRPDGLGVVSVGSLLAEAQPLGFDSVAEGDSFTWRATREFMVLAQLMASVEWGELDVLLFDLPPGAERTLQYAEFLGEGAQFVLVTVPSRVAEGVVARSLTVLEDAGASILGVVENMDGYLCGECGTVRPLFPRREGAETPWGAPVLGRLPFDPALAALCDRGWPTDQEPSQVPSLTVVDEVAQGLWTRLEAGAAAEESLDAEPAVEPAAPEEVSP